MHPRLLRTILAVQGTYYVLTGLWPLVHYGSFEAVLGAKTDDWLVFMVGLLAIAIGASLLTAVWRGRPRPESIVLAATSAVAFALIDVTFVARERISAFYLLDAAVEVGVLAALAVAMALRGRRQVMRHPRLAVPP